MSETFGERWLRERLEERQADLDRRRAIAETLGLDPNRCANIPTRRKALYPEQQDLVDIIDTVPLFRLRVRVKCRRCNDIVGEVNDTATGSDAEPVPTVLGPLLQCFQFSPERLGRRQNPQELTGPRYSRNESCWGFPQHPSWHCAPEHVTFTCESHGNHPVQRRQLLDALSCAREHGKPVTIRLG